MSSEDIEYNNLNSLKAKRDYIGRWASNLIRDTQYSYNCDPSTFLDTFMLTFYSCLSNGSYKTLSIDIPYFYDDEKYLSDVAEWVTEELDLISPRIKKTPLYQVLEKQ